LQEKKFAVVKCGFCLVILAFQGVFCVVNRGEVVVKSVVNVVR
jgi:hypothetical protein